MGELGALSASTLGFYLSGGGELILNFSEGVLVLALAMNILWLFNEATVYYVSLSGHEYACQAVAHWIMPRQDCDLCLLVLIAYYGVEGAGRQT